MLHELEWRNCILSSSAAVGCCQHKIRLSGLPHCSLASVDGCSCLPATASMQCVAAMPMMVEAPAVERTASMTQSSAEQNSARDGSEPAARPLRADLPPAVDRTGLPTARAKGSPHLSCGRCQSVTAPIAHCSAVLRVSVRRADIVSVQYCTELRLELAHRQNTQAASYPADSQQTYQGDTGQ